MSQVWFSFSTSALTKYSLFVLFLARGQGSLKFLTEFDVYVKKNSSFSLLYTC